MNEYMIAESKERTILSLTNTMNLWVGAEVCNGQELLDLLADPGVGVSSQLSKIIHINVGKPQIKNPPLRGGGLKELFLAVSLRGQSS